MNQRREDERYKYSRSNDFDADDAWGNRREFSRSPYDRDPESFGEESHWGRRNEAYGFGSPADYEGRYRGSDIRRSNISRDWQNRDNQYRSYPQDRSWHNREWRSDEHRFTDRGHNDRDESLWDSVKSFFGKGPKGYQRSDERVREEVCETLARHPEIDASEMEVNVKDGVVTLSGSVDNRWMKRRAEDTIENVYGVKDVRNELRVSPSSMDMDMNMNARNTGAGNQPNRIGLNNPQTNIQ